MTSQFSPRINAPLVHDRASDADLIHNSAIRIAEFLAAPVTTVGTEDPPADPVDGEAHAVGETPTGDWTGADPGTLFLWDADRVVWLRVDPAPGMRIKDSATGRRLEWDGSAWVAEKGTLLTVHFRMTHVGTGATSMALLKPDGSDTNQYPWVVPFDCRIVRIQFTAYHTNTDPGTWTLTVKDASDDSTLFTSDFEWSTDPHPVREITIEEPDFALTEGMVIDASAAGSGVDNPRVEALFVIERV